MNFFRSVAMQIPEYGNLLRNINNNLLSEGGNPLPALVTGLSHVHKAHFLAALALETSVGDALCGVPMNGVRDNIGDALCGVPLKTGELYTGDHTGSPLLVLVETESEALRLCEDINTFTGGNNAAVYPAKDLNFNDFETNSREYEYRRLNILSNIHKNGVKLVLSTPEAAGQFTIPPEILREKMFSIRQGDEIAINTITKKLIETGFSRCELIEGVSQFSVRGSIVDIFSPNNTMPVRIEFWGDTADNIGFFDKETQRRVESVSEVMFAPCSEILYDSAELAGKISLMLKKTRTAEPTEAKQTFLNDIEKLQNNANPKNPDKYLPLVYNRPASLFDYIKPCIILENVNCTESYRGASIRHEEDLKLLFESGALCRGLDKYMLTRGEFKDVLQERTVAYIDTFIRGSGLKLSEILNVRAVQLSSWSGEYKTLTEELRNYIGKGYAIVVFAGTEKAARTLALDLRDDNFPVDFSSDPKKIYAKRAYILAGTIGAGYEYPDAKLVMLSLARIVGADLVSARTDGRTQGSPLHKHKKRRKGEEIRNLTDINAGDYVVHQNYGIGIFEGVTKLTSDEISKDYIKIKYAGTDVLYVPVTQLDFISRYIGNTDSGTLKLNKLHSDAWQKTKAKAKAAASELAEELIALYSKRAKSEGHTFPKDNAEQVEFEEHFSYIETDDQLRCIEEIKADMQVGKPMDRLLCGDVGFGKTEVALRGAFKCVMDGKQCALLCPTTVLAWQHYQTAIKRMDGFPVNIELLSRFRSAREIKQVLEKLKKGIVDLVIGTHRLVQADVEFKNLGLVIIDEEQRFGVNHKEKFKETFTGVDVLTLSATPIPRTLNMAMSGVRDMSVINTPPQDRQPVTTYVIEHDWSVIAQAINKELRRNGQVYYIHNRIETILDCAAQLHELCPEARIGIGHGKLSEDELLEVWRKLLDGEIDILICTTIIETGVDVPNVNTLIIENADHMGLAQLHQLRGRVGRTNKRAYAYFAFKRGKVLTEISTKRLNAVREFTQFGSGFNIAMRDLEIRGAGSILGARQSGHLSSVGYDMYIRLLNEAVAEKKNESGAEKRDDTSQGRSDIATVGTTVDVKCDAYIPESYISNAAQRISCYKRIAEIANADDALDVTDELIDRYGEPPASVSGLIEAAEVRNMAGAAGIQEILQDGAVLKIKTDNPDMESVSRAVSVMDGRVSLDFSGKTEINVKLIKGENPLKAARVFLDAYRK
ncbi:MAG: transcription-repair coupling factor [Oscillospiraceae bacterium]|nr:transcription-repair coupling factor [Oscillospiraceae bacterium]